VRRQRERRHAFAALGAALVIGLVAFLGTTAGRAATTPATRPASAHAGSSTTTTPTTTSATEPATRLTSDRATKIFLADHKVADWLKRYPATVGTSATYANGIWSVGVFYSPAGEIVSGQVNDQTGQVVQAYTGPQVAWGMARGGDGFGGKTINSVTFWLLLCAVFLLGLVDWRRPFSLRTLDLLMLLSFSPSLWFFNHGHIFEAMPFVYPGFVYLIARCFWIGRRNRGTKTSVVWPTWLLIAATLFLVFVRADIDWNHSNVIDVGLSGVIGANRISTFESPYGNFPVETGRPPCGPADASGDIRDHIQTNGRCEAADAQGDTYGPVSYEAYLPGYLVFGWSGLWDNLPTAHATTILWDLIAIVGMWFVGMRFGGPKLGATLAFAWAAWPFTQYSASSNTNDLIMPAILIWGFYVLTSPFKRGLFAGFAAWTKFACLLVLPLWSGYPNARAWRPRIRFLWGLLAATLLSFSILLFDPSLTHAVKSFYHDTFSYQFSRGSPFSLWDWRQYHARGLPNLRWVQRVLYGLLIAGTVALAWWPRERGPLRIAAFTGMLIVGFESVLTHWSWLYLPWFFPFVAIALLMPRVAGPEPILADPLAEQRRLIRAWPERQRQLVGLGAASVVFMCCWAMLYQWVYSDPHILDLGIYQSYGNLIRHGEVPYRDFRVEYPPGALAAFVLPTFAGASHYSRAFGWLMELSGIACLGFMTLARASRFALAFVAISPLLIGAMAWGHFDFWPTAFVVGALAGLIRGRHRLGWASLAFAITIKLFAAVVVPIAIVWTLRRRGGRELVRSASVGLGVIVAVFLPFFVLSPGGVWQSLWGQLWRPFQIESLAGSFFEAFGHPQLAGTHGSIELGGHATLEVAFTVLLVAVLVGLWISFARGPAESGRLLRHAAAAVCAVIIFGKVLSPQFLIWLVPLVPLTRGRRGMAATGLLAVALVATQQWFPNHYYDYVDFGELAWLVFARNLILVAILALLTFPALRRRAPAPVPPPGKSRELAEVGSGTMA
jgi:Glycosyltransferase family 87